MSKDTNTNKGDNVKPMTLAEVLAKHGVSVETTRDGFRVKNKGKNKG